MDRFSCSVEPPGRSLLPTPPTIWRICTATAATDEGGEEHRGTGPAVKRDPQGAAETRPAGAPWLWTEETSTA
jgi:hypothetical protein